MAGGAEIGRLRSRHQLRRPKHEKNTDPRAQHAEDEDKLYPPHSGLTHELTSFPMMVILLQTRKPPKEKKLNGGVKRVCRWAQRAGVSDWIAPGDEYLTE
jgi:hypothetical protein